MNDSEFLNEVDDLKIRTNKVVKSLINENEDIISKLDDTVFNFQYFSIMSIAMEELYNIHIKYGKPLTFSKTIL